MTQEASCTFKDEQKHSRNIEGEKMLNKLNLRGERLETFCGTRNFMG